MAVFSGPALRKNLHAGDADGLEYEFFPAAGLPARRVEEGHFEGALVEIGPESSTAALKALRAGPAPQAGGQRVAARGRRDPEPLARAGLRLPPRLLAHGRPARARGARPPGGRAFARRPRPPRRRHPAEAAHDHAAPGHPHRHREDGQLHPGAAQDHRADHGQGPGADPLRGLVHPHARRGEAGAHLRAGPGREGQRRGRVPGEGGGGDRGLGGADGRAHHRQRRRQGPALRPPLRRLHPVPDPLRALRSPHLARAHHRGGAGHQQARAASSARPTWSCC